MSRKTRKEAPESGAPDMYRIDMSGDGDGDKWSPEAEVSGTTLTYTDDLSKAVDAAIDKNDDLDDPVNVARYYRVFAVNSHGSGQVSTYESANTKNVGKPGAVGAFGAAASGPEAINLTWTVPDDGGSDILGYCILAWSADARDDRGRALLGTRNRRRIAKTCSSPWALVITMQPTMMIRLITVWLRHSRHRPAAATRTRTCGPVRRGTTRPTH